MTAPADLVRRALALHAEQLIRLPNVVGLGVGLRATHGDRDPQPCLAVYVSRKLPIDALADHERVPRTVRVEGVQVRTRVVETGPFVRDVEGAPS